MNKSYIPRKESIVLTAIDIINELGIHELSTREIARRQGVSDASLYRHFKSKQDILLEVLDYYSSYDIFVINTIEGKNFNARKSIIQFYNAYASYYENYPAITAVGLAHSYLLYDGVVADKFKQILKVRSEFILKQVKNGQLDGSIDVRFTDEILCHILQGTFDDITLNWRINNHKFSLKEKVIAAIEMILKIS